MPATVVDLVLLVDTSDSMKPCFERLRDNLSQLLGPLRQASFSVRIGLVGYAAGRDSTGVVYDHTFLGGSGIPLVKGLLFSGRFPVMLAGVRSAPPRPQ